MTRIRKISGRSLGRIRPDPYKDICPCGCRGVAFDHDERGSGPAFCWCCDDEVVNDCSFPVPCGACIKDPSHRKNLAITYAELRERPPGDYMVVRNDGRCALYAVSHGGKIVRISALVPWSGRPDFHPEVDMNQFLRRRSNPEPIEYRFIRHQPPGEYLAVHANGTCARYRVGKGGGVKRVSPLTPWRPTSRANPSSVSVRRLSKSELVQRNKKAGGKFFSSENMKFFGSKVGPAFEGPGGTYFVTSEQVWGQSQRSYGVHRLAPSGRVETATEVDDRRPTLEAAVRLAQTLARFGWKEARLNPTSAACPKCRGTATVRKTGVSCYRCGFIKLQDRARKVGNCSVCRRPIMDSDGYDKRATGEVKHFLCSEDGFKSNPSRLPKRGPETVRKVAKRFAEILNEWLTPDQIREINEKHAAHPDRNWCATHDYCDPNEAMNEALEEVQGMVWPAPITRAGEIWGQVWHRAWTMASKAGFDPKRI